jgi:transposase
MAYHLFDRHGIEISVPSISRILAEARWSWKVAKKIAQQRNAELRAHWSLFWRPSQLVFIDESASAPRTGDRKRGWSPIGLHCLDIQRLGRDKRWSVLPALTVEGYLKEPLIVEGAVTMDLFVEWFEEKVLPQLRPGQIVVMDNASIHRLDLVEDLCLEAGIQLKFLPPYSPDYNPIEPSFNTLKLWVKRHIRMASSFIDFGAFMAHAIEEVGAAVDVEGYFEKCGYIEVDLGVNIE